MAPPDEDGHPRRRHTTGHSSKVKLNGSDIELKRSENAERTEAVQSHSSEESRSGGELESNGDNAVTSHCGGEISTPPLAPSANALSCNICLDPPVDAVVTKCGHMYCWSCLDEWLERHGACPVCKSGVDRTTDVIPVYGSGGDSGQKRPHPATAPRPEGRRQPAPPPSNRSNFRTNFGWPFQTRSRDTAIHVGIFPFGFFGISFGTESNRQPQTEEERQAQFVSIIMIAIVVFVFVHMIFLDY